MRKEGKIYMITEKKYEDKNFQRKIRKKKDFIFNLSFLFLELLQTLFILNNISDFTSYSESNNLHFFLNIFAFLL